MKEFDESLRKNKWVGFASFYLGRCEEKSKTGEQIDKEIYAKLIKLDERLGTKASEQLFDCLWRTTRWDIIKV